MRVYDYKTKSWRTISKLRFLLHRLVASDRFATAIMGEHGFDFKGANEVKTYEYKVTNNDKR